MSTATTATTAALREQLDKDMISYLSTAGVTDQKLTAKALHCIQDAAHETCTVDDEVRSHYRDFFRAIEMADGAEFYFKIAARFSPRHYEKIVAFVQRYESMQEAEWEAAEALEAAIEREIDEQHDPLDDSKYDELGGPDFAVCIYQDRIEVRAYGPGMGELLPKHGRKYIGCRGDIRWRYPLSALPSLERLGRPVVKVTSVRVQP